MEPVETNNAFEYDKIGVFAYTKTKQTDPVEEGEVKRIHGEDGIDNILSETGLDNIPDLLLNGYTYSLFTVNTSGDEGESFLFDTNRNSENEFPLVSKIIDLVFHNHYTKYEKSELHVSYSASAIISGVFYDLTTRTPKDMSSMSASPFGDMLSEVIHNKFGRIENAETENKKVKYQDYDFPILLDDRVFRPISDTAELLEAIRLTRISASRWETISPEVQNVIAEICVERVDKITENRFCGKLVLFLLGCVKPPKLLRELTYINENSNGIDLVNVSFPEWKNKVTSTNILSDETLLRVKNWSSESVEKLSESGLFFRTITQLGKSKQIQERKNILQAYSFTSTFGMIASKYMNSNILGSIVVVLPSGKGKWNDSCDKIVKNLSNIPEISLDPQPYIIPCGPNMIDYIYNEFSLDKDSDGELSPSDVFSPSSTSGATASTTITTSPTSIDQQTLRRTLLEPMTSTGVKVSLINGILGSLMAMDDNKNATKSM